jgi:hypothetical protein
MFVASVRNSFVFLNQKIKSDATVGKSLVEFFKNFSRHKLIGKTTFIVFVWSFGGGGLFMMSEK